MIDTPKRIFLTDDQNLYRQPNPVQINYTSERLTDYLNQLVDYLLTLQVQTPGAQLLLATQTCIKPHQGQHYRPDVACPGQGIYYTPARERFKSCCGLDNIAYTDAIYSLIY